MSPRWTQTLFLFVGFAGWNGHVYGQASPAAAESTVGATRTRDQLFADGLKFASQKDWSGAYAAYKAAWALDRHWGIAANLGAVEIELGKFRDAAEHIAFSLSKFPKDESHKKAREDVEKRFAEAKAHVGAVVLQVDAARADLFFDGKWIGQSPWSDKIFAEPGQHVVTARLGSKSANETVALSQGTEQEAHLTLRADGASGASGASASASDPIAPPDPSRGAEQSVSEQRAAWVPIIGGSLVAVGLGVGIGFTIRSGNKADERDALKASVPASSPCASSSIYGAQCAQLAQLDNESASARGLAIAGFAVAGASAAFTAAYWFWPRKGGANQVVLPSFSAHHAGLNLFATF